MLFIILVYNLLEKVESFRVPLHFGLPLRSLIFFTHAHHRLYQVVAYHFGHHLKKPHW